MFITSLICINVTVGGRACMSVANLLRSNSVVFGETNGVNDYGGGGMQ